MKLSDAKNGAVGYMMYCGRATLVRHNNKNKALEIGEVRPDYRFQRGGEILAWREIEKMPEHYMIKGMYPSLKNACEVLGITIPEEKETTEEIAKRVTKKILEETTSALDSKQSEYKKVLGKINHDAAEQRINQLKQAFYAVSAMPGSGIVFEQ